ncbi:hypothetical protein [Neorhodopirellula pilleata]|uniref:Carboxypeptidase regulatory-like domain-containing protein n=1 Tax=Neorhodopirellula pilleata TaxID=2714738 RepID=A0A5C5ZZW9_9BACT|nr:hypothetical protein [Neorhodopirellula pilleata]TWT92610.1 hypothetical protein Pla100_46300 [Neorhodopirellula pilleata]
MSDPAQFDAAGLPARADRCPGRKSSLQCSPMLMLMLAALAIVGCRPSSERTYPVSGLVRFPDGQVLREGSVEFEIIGRNPPITATGVIAPDGTFTLGTYELDDGAFAGKHRVAIIADPMIGTGAERPGLIPESPLPPKYATFDNSGIILEVLPEDNQIIIDVEAKP